MTVSKYDMNRIDAMEGHEFERFVATLLRNLGYEKVEVTPGSGDQGVDVLAENDGVRYAIQCKCYSSDLGNTPVQEVNTGKMVYHCHVGVVVTNRYFTQSAREAAKATGVLLWDRSKLEKLIAQANFEVEPTEQQKDSLTLWSGSPLLRRGGIALKDKEWKKASQFFDRVLNTDPENAEAYLGLVMAEAMLSGLDDFVQAYINSPRWRLNQNNLLHAKEFAEPKLTSWFVMLEELREAEQKRAIAQRKKDEEQKQKAEEEERLEKEQIQIEERNRLKQELKEAEIRLAHSLQLVKRARFLISRGVSHFAGVKADGTVVAVGDNRAGQCDVYGWKNIVAIATARTDGLANYIASGYTVGLKSDGTLTTTGKNIYGRCDVGSWTDIIAIDTDVSGFDTVGLKVDGTVMAVGKNNYGQCNVSSWRDIVAITAGFWNTVGLKSDGTVVAVGYNERGQCDVKSWEDIVAIAAGWWHTVGLKSDGTVVAVGINGIGRRCDVSSWRDIVSIAAGNCHTVGLKSDGTVIAVGDNGYGQCNVNQWRSIVAISAGKDFTAGLKSDGTVVTVGYNESGQCNTSSWKLFNNIETLEQERIEARRQRDENERQALKLEQVALQAELAKLKGPFTGKRRREIDTRLKKIEKELRR